MRISTKKLFSAIAITILSIFPSLLYSSGLWHTIGDEYSPGQRTFSSVSPDTYWYGQESTGSYNTGSNNNGSQVFGPFYAQENTGISFWSWEETENFQFPDAVDTRKIYISADSGTTWELVREMFGIEREWHNVLIDLTAYSGQTILIKAVFDTMDRFNNNFRGWFIDDVLFSGITQQDRLSDALDNKTMTFTTGGAADWISQTIDAKYGGTALRSGVIGDSQLTYVETIVAGPGYISFYYKASSEYGFDYLDFFIDGVLATDSYYRCTGTQNEFYWTKITLYVAPGSHVMRWQYKKDESNSAGRDCGWLDRVNFSPGGMPPDLPPADLSTLTPAGTATTTRTRTVSPTKTPSFSVTPTLTPASVSLNDALDNAALSLSQQQVPAWRGQESVFYFGGSSAQCSGLADTQASRLTANISGPCTVYFEWKVSCEEDYDYLTLYVDGEETDYITGETDWKQASVDLPAGEHSLSWEYSKDIDTSAGLDSAWVDKVEIISTTPTTTMTVSGTPTETLSMTYTPAFTATHTPTATMSKTQQAVMPTPALQEALDNFTIVFSASGTVPWKGQGDKFFYGGDSAQAGSMADSSSTTLQASVTGAGTISFYWKSDTEWGDYLYFYVDGAPVADIYAQQDWGGFSFNISGAGSHLLEWVYAKDDYRNYESYGYVHDRVWVDKVEYTSGTRTITPTLTVTGTATVKPTLSFTATAATGTETPIYTPTNTRTLYPTASMTPTVAASVSINQAVDNYTITFTSGGAAPWRGEINQGAYFDGDDARSGPIGDNEYSYLEARINGPGILSFYASVSADGGDGFYLEVDGAFGSSHGSYGMGSEWNNITEYIYPGVNVVRWVYRKDSSTSAFDDCLRIDRITFNPAATPSPWPTDTPVYTPTVTLTITAVIYQPITVVPESVWYKATENSGLGCRYGHKCVVLNNKMWLTGGYNGGGAGDVWSSADGVGWNRENPSAFPYRVFHGSVSWKGRIWVIGGMGQSSSTVYNDVWSSADGASWKLENGNAPFHKRYGSACLVYNGRIWVIGGAYYDGIGATVYYNDVWSSADGVSWIKEKDNAAFSPRALAAAAVFNNRMWLSGGSDNTSMVVGIDSKVWSSADGKNWTLATANPGFGVKSMSNMLQHDGKLWMIGGMQGQDAGGNIVFGNDLWFTEDGIKWMKASDDVDYGGRAAHESVEFDGRMWLIGGIAGNYISNCKTDVWYTPFKGTPTITPSHTVSPTISPTHTISKTFTISPTHSVSPTISATPTITETATISATFTASPDVTDTPTATITISPVIGPPPDAGMTWQLATAAASFSERSGPSSVVFDGKMWVIGGLNPAGAYNDVFSSVDGANWVTETASAAFGPRGFHTSVVMNNRIWIIGGGPSYGSNYSDVWSSADGINWDLETTTTPFNRCLHASVVFGGRMWVIGGMDNTFGLHNDVWSSADGVNWTQETVNAGFSKRFSQSAIVFNGKIWVLNGNDFVSDYNDIWSSSDGVNWANETVSAAFVPSYGNGLVEFGGKVWLISGYDASGPLKGVWSSDNCVDWSAVTLNAEFTPRGAFGCVTYDNKLWAIGGAGFSSSLNDVWFSPPDLIVTPTFTYTAGTGTETPTATPTLTWTAEVNTFTRTATSTPTETGTFTATQTGTIATGTITGTATQTITGTPPTETITPTDTITSTPHTETITATFTQTGTVTLTLTSTVTVSVTYTTEISATMTSSPTNTATATSTNTVAFTSTFTATGTITASNTATASATGTPSNTASNTATVTATDTVTATRTVSATSSVTITPSRTATRTRTQTPTFTRTPGNTATVTSTPSPTAVATEGTFGITGGMTFPNPYDPGTGAGLSVRYRVSQDIKSALFCVYSNSFRLIRRSELSGQDSAGLKVKIIPDNVFSDFGNGTYFYCIEGVSSSGDKVRSKAGVVIIIK